LEGKKKVFENQTKI